MKQRRRKSRCRIGKSNSNEEREDEEEGERVKEASREGWDVMGWDGCATGKMRVRKRAGRD